MALEFCILESPAYEECRKIIELGLAAFGTQAETIFFLKIIADFGKIFVASENEQPLCVVQTLRDWNDPKMVQIASFATHPDYQKRGVGTFTAAEMIKQLILMGATSVGIRIPPHHEAMLRIFRDKLGFSIISELPNYYGAGENRLYLERNLCYRVNT